MKVCSASNTVATFIGHERIVWPCFSHFLHDNTFLFDAINGWDCTNILVKMSSVFNLIEHCLALAEGPDLKARICLFQASTDCSAYTSFLHASSFSVSPRLKITRLRSHCFSTFRAKLYLLDSSTNFSATSQYFSVLDLCFDSTISFSISLFPKEI